MATKTTAKKTTRKTTTRKTTTRQASKPAKSVDERVQEAVEAERNAKSCAYPGCSERSTQTFGDNNVPSCDIHATIFENQAEDGAGIQQLMETYKG